MNMKLRIRKNHFLFFIISSFFIYSCSSSKNNSDLLIIDAHADTLLLEGSSIVAYVVLKNLTNEALVINKISCDGFLNAFFHETKIDDLSGMTVMSKLESLTLNPKSKLEFKPGGKHIMIMGPGSSNDLLKEIKCDLETDNGVSYPISFPIR